MLIPRLFQWLGAVIALSASAACAQLPAFNGAEGYGGSFAGTPPSAGWFSNATVYHVTNLNDSGPGSLRNAFVQHSSNKIIVFDVGGTIRLTSGPLDIKNLSNYYIAGQTAPSPITVYGNMTQLTHSAGRENRNVVLRYISFRRGAEAGEDSITFSGGGLGTNLILDHVSASWSDDEVLSVTNNNTNVTVQYSMIHDALTSDHAYGSLLRARIDSNVSMHHNLYANNVSRQPRFGSYLAKTLTAEFRNNVVYNWGDRASYAGGSSETEQEFADINYVGNYLIAGPGTVDNANRAFHVDRNIDVRVYQSGNFIDSDRSLNPGGVPNGANTGWGMFEVSSVTDQTLTQMAAPFPTPAVTTQAAIDAYRQVIDHVGNFWWSRDAIDARVINNVRTNTGPPIGAAAPNAGELSGLFPGLAIIREPGWDTDGDGMPDHWERAHGLNRFSIADFMLDYDNDGYVNLQEYLDEVGAFPAPAPIAFHGGTNDRYAQITNWRSVDGLTAGSHWQPTRFDEAVINSGTVVVDTVGQHAGVLTIGSAAGDNARLEITSGWLEVEEAVVIGAAPAATASLHLSGGILRAPVLRRGAGGTFSFTGGILETGVVEFDLESREGMIAPGPDIGQTRVMGDLTLIDSALQIQIAPAAISDTVVVDGTATLGGALEILPVGDVNPSPGDRWKILSAEYISGSFSFMPPAFSLQQQDGDLWLVFGSAPLAGDYNNDGKVDAADFIAWRAIVGTPTALPNETASFGVVDNADYEAWRANFGASRQASGSIAAALVPEPASFSLALVIGLTLQLRRRRSLR
jgi:pectate lyase